MAQQDPNHRPALLQENPVYPLLESLLTSDAHLRATCLHAPGLARALEVVLLDQLGEVASVVTSDSPTMLSEIATDLLSKLYAQHYYRKVYFHLYNLVLSTSWVHLPNLGASFDILWDVEIPLITGEHTKVSTLHPPHTGPVFLTFGEDTGTTGDFDWWTAKREDARYILRALRYLKYAIVDLDYSAVEFSPHWVNSVRRYGVAISGHPRQDAQRVPYTIAAAEARNIERYLRVIERHRHEFVGGGSTFRQALATGASYYEAHHERTTPEDQLIDLSIALEALFSPPSQTELGFRIAQSAALLVGQNAAQRQDIFDLVRSAYGARSTLVHSGKSPFKGGVKFSLEHLAKLGNLVRTAMVRLAVLYIRGERERTGVLTDMAAAALDAGRLATLRERSDDDRLLFEEGEFSR